MTRLHILAHSILHGLHGPLHHAQHHRHQQDHQGSQGFPALRGAEQKKVCGRLFCFVAEEKQGSQRIWDRNTPSYNADCRNTGRISSFRLSVKMPLISPHIAALISQFQAAGNGSKSSDAFEHQPQAKTTEASSMLSLFHLLDRDSNGEVQPKHSNLF